MHFTHSLKFFDDYNILFDFRQMLKLTSVSKIIKVAFRKVGLDSKLLTY